MPIEIYVRFMRALLEKTACENDMYPTQHVAFSTCWSWEN